MIKEFTLIAVAIAMCYCTAMGQSSLKIISNGNVGVSTDNPIEKFQVNGAINIGNTDLNTPGSIRWTGYDFEGFDGIDWKSLTQCNCDVTENNSSTNTNDEAEDNSQADSNDNSSETETVASGCQAANQIATKNLTQDPGWSNQINTEGLGFEGVGELCYTISSYEGNTTQMMGLSTNAEEDKAYENINYAFYHRIASTLNSHRVYVWENNQRKGIFLNSSESYAGATFCIKRNENSEIEYFINDELVYTSEITSDEALYFDNSFYGFSEGSSSIWDHQPSNIKVSDIALCSEDLAGLTQGQNDSSELLQGGIGILQQNIPNPFIDHSKILYDLSGEVYSKAELVISNSIGQIISKKNISEQTGQIEMNRENLTTGIYQYTIYLDGTAMDTKQMILN